jgi:hypothetical protein
MQYGVFEFKKPRATLAPFALPAPSNDLVNTLSRFLTPDRTAVLRGLHERAHEMVTSR